MANSVEDEFGDDRRVDELDFGNGPADENLEEPSDDGLVGEVERSDSGSTEDGRGGGLTDRLREILRNGGDGDLLLQQSDRDDNVLQWLQALDLQVMGACRADERLKPLLKLNISSAMGDDPLLVHLSQHFEMPEVGLLARCLCAPLVSIRVGKITKQGTLLCPTAMRGRLNLTLLPSSDLRISFVWDDGCIERVATLGADSDESVVIEEILADKSGRSFFVKLQGGQVSYYWCSEQSKVIGLELLAKVDFIELSTWNDLFSYNKYVYPERVYDFLLTLPFPFFYFLGLEQMKDLLYRKPSLARLTGISELRLDCFATHLRAYLLGPTAGNREENSKASSIPLDWDLNTHSALASKHCTRNLSGLLGKTHPLYQGILSPRSNSFKETTSRNFSLRSLPREKARQRVESLRCPSVNANEFVTSPSTKETSISCHPEIKLSGGAIEEKSSPPLSFLESLGRSATVLPSSSPPLSKATSSSSSLFSPCYCWCPPLAPAFQYTVQPPCLPIASAEAIPPLPPLISGSRSTSSFVLPNPPLNLTEVPSLDFPAFLPDPTVMAPRPVSSFITMSGSQQIPTFTPLICDPIVHIPLVDICSSGQGYLVSAGPAISINVPPLRPIPETESLVEKSARETLRLLLSSSQSNPQLMDVLPSVLNNPVDKDNPLVLGSRGLFSATRDVESITNSMAAIGLFSSLQSGCFADDMGKREMFNQLKRSGDSEGSSNADDGSDDSTSLAD
ncbi:hypothetical protein Scep_005579 [Stephania cephalantha]|uniref:Uncharacterized protein n=1 Tax=Stephania cephalantha TaxID=152367 RepID=A0AAP0KVI0_9MAGN